MYCTHMICIALFLPVGCISVCGELGGVSAPGMGPGEAGEGTGDSVNTDMRQTQHCSC